MSRRIHKLETSTEDDARGGTYEYGWIACRDPEHFQEPDDRQYIAERAWARVTCKLCLAKFNAEES